MLLLAQAEPVTRIFSFPTTDGVTMALVLFQLAALLFPAVIKNRQQFFASFGVTLGIILLFTLRLMLYDTIGVQVFGGVVTGLLQIAALVLIFLSCGGMTVGQFANELKGSYEVIRRGGEEKEVVIPLSGQRPSAGERRPPTRAPLEEDDDVVVDDQGRRAYTLDAGEVPSTGPTPVTPPPAGNKRPDPGGIPLE